MSNTEVFAARLPLFAGHTCPFNLSLVQGLINKGGPDPADYAALNHWFEELLLAADAGYVDRADFPIYWDHCGPMCRIETLGGHVCRKPHGYAGDFEIIDRIHTGWVSPDPGLQKWDRFFHSQPATRAVRNRSDYLHALLDTLVERFPRQEVRVLNLGSGPCRDILTYMESRPGAQMRFDCVDMAPGAIDHVDKLCADHLDRIRFHHANVLRFKPSGSYHLVWSAGLFDYLADRTFSLLLNRLYPAVLPGGELVVGNFSTSNPSRPYMEFGHWNLNHRDQALMALLASRAGIPLMQLSFGAEPEGINLFMHLKK